MLLIEGRVRGQRINVLVDTGAGSNFANTALLNALEARPVPVDAAANETLRAYTAGAAIVLDTAMLIPEVDLGDVGARNVLAYVGDFHIFDVWGLRDEPTLLVGMQVLTQAQGLSIDYDRGVVHFRFEPGIRTGSRIAGATNNVSITVSRQN